MASKMASYVTGYDDERFEQVISQSFHCIICTNVLKDPVMCRHNEHLFCRACITRHLMNSQTCPTCMEPLTVDTLTQAPRGIRNLLAELKIRCEFFDRGCAKFVELGDLERHVADCGFAPVVCSNAGCQLEVNKQDLIHHETAVCELRQVQCHSCDELSQEMDAMKVNMAAMNEKLDKNEKKLDRNAKKMSENVQRIEMNLKAVEQNLVAKVELVQEQLNKQEVSNRHVQGDIVEINKSLNEITKQLERMTQQGSHEVQVEQEEMKKGIAEADEMETEPKVVIAGGYNKGDTSNSVEMFSLSTQTWTPLRSMKECRNGASSVVYNNQVVVTGGCGNNGNTKSMERLSKNVVQADQSITWEKLNAKLPGRLRGHCSVVYNGRLIVIGGYDDDKCACSDSITEVSLVPPYTTKLLTTMPQGRWYHGVAIFGDKIVICGGLESMLIGSILRSMVMYDIRKNKCMELAPLPYPVYSMASVKWGDENVMIMGGADGEGEALNKVSIYNIKSQKSRVLPDMKYKRKGCVAAVVRDTAIVMGGRDERRNYLKTVESFKFDRYSWNKLPEMHNPTVDATAVVCSM